MSSVPVPALPERPENLPPRATMPALARPWKARMALPIGLAALLFGLLVYTIVAAIRSALVDATAHQDGLVGIAVHGTPSLLITTSTLAQDLALVAGAALVAASATSGRLRIADLGLRRPPRAWRAVGLVFGAYVAFVAIAAAWTSALGITDRENVPVDLGTRDSTLALVAAAFLVCVVAPVCEELFFRGFLFGALRRRGLPLAAGATGLTFGLAHVASAPIGFIVPLAALGVILCLLYERTRSLYPCIGLHCLNNSIAFGVGDGRGWLVPVVLAGAGLTILALLRGVERTFGARAPG